MGEKTLYQPNTRQERRQFTRVPFVSRISVIQQQRQWQANVVDISLNGILISGDLSNFDEHEPASGHILFKSRQRIAISLHYVRNQQSFWGFSFGVIDSESVKFLRKILSEELGEEACRRELKALFSYHQ